MTELWMKPIKKLVDRLNYLCNLDKRKEEIINSSRAGQAYS